MKKTKYDSKQNYLAGFFFYLIFGILLCLLFFWFGRIFQRTEDAVFSFFGTLIPIINIFMIGPIFFISAFSMLHGYIKGKRDISNSERKIKLENPYMYYRELPNQFGIGVSSLLIDSELENEKDIIAVILDLCAKGYLHLIKTKEMYTITVLKGVDDNLLSNEKYILEHIIHKNIGALDYQNWYKLCLKDGIRLGVYKDSGIIVDGKLKDYQVGNDKVVKNVLWISMIIAIIAGIISYITKFKPDIEMFKNTSPGDFSLLLGFITFFFLSFGFNISYAIYLMTKKSIYLGKQFKEMSYKHTLSNHLVRTPLGEEEIKKLWAFRAFIQDFGAFAPKNPEEIILWDRYLSYAAMFGLTKEIMKLGYTKLVENTSFHIDDIDNIHLHNIVVKEEK